MSEFEEKKFESEESSYVDKVETVEENQVETPNEPQEYEGNFNNVNSNEDFKPFEYQEPATPKPPYINIENTPIKEETKTSVGIKIFAGILTLCIVAGICLVGGYFLGRNKKSINKTDISTVIEEKPVNKDSKNAAEIYDEVKKSVVYITVYSDSNTTSMGSASGVVYTKDGYILTCDHIYSDVVSPKFKVTLYDGTQYDAKFVAGDTRSDLAVLKVDATDLTPAAFGNSNENIVGENAYAVGYSCGFEDGSSITSGIISANDRRITSGKSSYSTTLIQIDTPINPGNSGGALVNSYAQVIGITSSKLSGSIYEGVGFAIPSVSATSIADSLIKNGYVKGRPKLGITYTVINSITSEKTGVPTGLCIAEISSDSELYGKEIAKGSIITHINGEKIINSRIILDFIDKSRAGDSLTVTIYDTEKKNSKDYTVKLIEDKGSSSYTEQDKQTDYSNGLFGNDESDQGNNLPF